MPVRNEINRPPTRNEKARSRPYRDPVFHAAPPAVLVVYSHKVPHLSGQPLICRLTGEVPASTWLGNPVYWAFGYGWFGKLTRNNTQFSRVLTGVAQHKQSSVLKATDFEYRHQALVHQLIVGAAFVTYLVDRDDIVWRLVKSTTTPHILERLVFILATVLVAMGAGLCTRTRAFQKVRGTSSDDPHGLLHPSRYLGDLSYAIGLGSLAPVPGFLILVGGEAFRVLRLAGRTDGRPQNWQEHRLSVFPASPSGESKQRTPEWKNAIRHEAAKWGILATMTVFVITLQDRHAEVLALGSFLIGVLVNAPTLTHLARLIHQS